MTDNQLQVQPSKKNLQVRWEEEDSSKKQQQSKSIRVQFALEKSPLASTSSQPNLESLDRTLPQKSSTDKLSSKRLGNSPSHKRLYQSLKLKGKEQSPLSQSPPRQLLPEVQQRSVDSTRLPAAPLGLPAVGARGEKVVNRVNIGRLQKSFRPSPGSKLRYSQGKKEKGLIHPQPVPQTSKKAGDSEQQRIVTISSQPQSSLETEENERRSKPKSSLNLDLYETNRASAFDHQERKSSRNAVELKPPGHRDSPMNQTQSGYSPNTADRNYLNYLTSKYGINQKKYKFKKNLHIWSIDGPSAMHSGTPSIHAWSRDKGQGPHDEEGFMSDKIFIHDPFRRFAPGEKQAHHMEQLEKLKKEKEEKKAFLYGSPTSLYGSDNYSRIGMLKSKIERAVKVNGAFDRQMMNYYLQKNKQKFRQNLATKSLEKEVNSITTIVNAHQKSRSMQADSLESKKMKMTQINRTAELLKDKKLEHNRMKIESLVKRAKFVLDKSPRQREGQSALMSQSHSFRFGTDLRISRNGQVSQSMMSPAQYGANPFRQQYTDASSAMNTSLGGGDPNSGLPQLAAVKAGAAMIAQQSADVDLDLPLSELRNSNLSQIGSGSRQQEGVITSTDQSIKVLSGPGQASLIRIRDQDGAQQNVVFEETKTETSASPNRGSPPRSSKPQSSKRASRYLEVAHKRVPHFALEKSLDSEDEQISVGVSVFRSESSIDREKKQSRIKRKKTIKDVKDEFRKVFLEDNNVKKKLSRLEASILASTLSQRSSNSLSFMKGLLELERKNGFLYKHSTKIYQVKGIRESGKSTKDAIASLSEVTSEDSFEEECSFSETDSDEEEREINAVYKAFPASQRSGEFKKKFAELTKDRPNSRMKNQKKKDAKSDFLFKIGQVPRPEKQVKAKKKPELYVSNTEEGTKKRLSENTARRRSKLDFILGKNNGDELTQEMEDFRHKKQMQVQQAKLDKAKRQAWLNLFLLKQQEHLKEVMDSFRFDPISEFLAAAKEKNSSDMASSQHGGFGFLASMSSKVQSTAKATPLQTPKGEEAGSPQSNRDHATVVGATDKLSQSMTQHHKNYELTNEDLEEILDDEEKVEEQNNMEQYQQNLVDLIQFNRDIQFKQRIDHSLMYAFFNLDVAIELKKFLAKYNMSLQDLGPWYNEKLMMLKYQMQSHKSTDQRDEEEDQKFIKQQTKQLKKEMKQRRRFMSTLTKGIILGKPPKQQIKNRNFILSDERVPGAGRVLSPFQKIDESFSRSETDDLGDLLGDAPMRSLNIPLALNEVGSIQKLEEKSVGFGGKISSNLTSNPSFVRYSQDKTMNDLEFQNSEMELLQQQIRRQMFDRAKIEMASPLKDIVGADEAAKHPKKKSPKKKKAAGGKPAVYKQLIQGGSAIVEEEDQVVGVATPESSTLSRDPLASAKATGIRSPPEVASSMDQRNRSQLQHLNPTKQPTIPSHLMSPQTEHQNHQGLMKTTHSSVPSNPEQQRQTELSQDSLMGGQGIKFSGADSSEQPKVSTFARLNQQSGLSNHPPLTVKAQTSNVPFIMQTNSVPNAMLQKSPQQQLYPDGLPSGIKLNEASPPISGMVSRKTINQLNQLSPVMQSSQFNPQMTTGRVQKSENPAHKLKEDLYDMQNMLSFELGIKNKTQQKILKQIADTDGVSSQQTKKREKSVNRKIKGESLKIVRQMEKNLQKFRKMQSKVEKTKAQQEEANDSSGSEGYKLWQKYKNYSYVRISLPKKKGSPGSAITSAMVTPRSPQSTPDESSSAEDASVPGDIESPFSRKRNKIQHPLKKMPFKNYDKIERDEKKKKETERKRQQMNDVWKMAAQEMMTKATDEHFINMDLDLSNLQHKQKEIDKQIFIALNQEKKANAKLQARLERQKRDQVNFGTRQNRYNVLSYIKKRI